MAILLVNKVLGLENDLILIFFPCARSLSGVGTSARFEVLSTMRRNILSHSAKQHFVPRCQVLAVCTVTVSCLNT
jgi:hypothetical protein